VFGGSAHTNVAIEFGFRGVGTTNSNSCASGTVSVGEALRYIRDDFADVILAGGAEAPLSPLTYGAFAIIKTMSQWNGDASLSSRPFDRLRDGFVMGEGAASLVIEELEHARARKAHIYAEVLGYSLTNDAFHMTSPLPSGESCIRAMQDALADARIEKEQIDYINAHASSTQLNDSTETASIKAVFGQLTEKTPVSGTKGYYAHPLGATGAIEAALCALALDRQWIPPTINYANPDPACDLNVVPNHGRKADLNYVMSNSFGFGGINACLVLGRV
jgi:3-oxoacyl-[acyl-carrier-protein] synthase II